MDFGGTDRRKTKNDLKKKRLNRGYKKGGKFRSANVEEDGSKVDKMGKIIVGKKKKKSGRREKRKL
jgi:hypothetical protein